MSISINSINYGDDLTQAAENGEVNGDAINLDNYGQFDGKNCEQSVTDQQQLKEFRQKFAKMEMELKMAKLELENKALEQKLRQQEMMVEQKTLKEKVAKIEQEKEKNDAKCLPVHHREKERAATEERFSQLQNDQKEIFEKINELEKQREEQSKATADQLSKILEKISELEKQQKEQTKANADQLSKILKKISEMEKQQHEEITTKANSDQFSKMQNDQKILLEKISELEKEQKQRKALLNFRQNYWDANSCHENLQIIGNKSLTVHYKRNFSADWCSVFAKHPILLNNNSSDIFYYEISIGNKKCYVIFGFAVKQQNKFDGTILSHKGTYAYYNGGDICINGEGKGRNGKYSYGVGDTVGIGVNSATRQIIFTKNGLRLDFSDFLVAPSFADDSFHPFVFLLRSDDKIEANFGPNFKFDLTTL